ncbi:MAG: hypothetical protein V3W11_02235 [bacterium]
MKVKLFITLATAAVLCVAIIACSSLKGGEEEKPAPTSTPAPTPEPEVGKVTKATSGNTTTFTGVLRGANDSNKFDVFAENDLIEVEFVWPDETFFHVKVLGMAGDELGDFDLSEGEIIELTGGGKFSLIVYSRSGDGAWTATYTD